MASIDISPRKEYLFRPVNLVAAAYLVIALFGLGNYLQPGSTNLLLGLLAVPFAWKTDPGKRGSRRYGWLALTMLLLCFFMPVKTLLYFSIGLALLFFTESFYGKTSLPALLVIVLASPVFQYIGDVFSFPIRLQLTQLAGSLLSFFDPGAGAKGNMILYHGHEFAVDPACMGLNMITASLLCGVMLISFYQVKYKRKANAWLILFYLAVVFLLNVLCNLSRIILVVQLNIQPETLSHDIAGLACFIIYVLLPAVLLASFLVRRSVAFNTTAGLPAGIPVRALVIHLGLLSTIFLLSFKVAGTDTFSRFRIPASNEFTGYTISNPAPGIIKMNKAGVLIYIKYIRGFYDTEHNPMICWTGSGYEFKNVAIEKIGGINVFAGMITNNTDTFYSAWWYDNGNKNTTSQLEWRWDLLRGANHYALVNISCSTRKQLETEVQKIIHQKTLDPFFNN